MQSSSSESLFTREEALHPKGSSRRGSLVLLLIETRTTDHMVAEEVRTQQVNLASDNTAFLEAAVSLRRQRHPLHIYDIERYAAAWRNLVPESAQARAVLAHRLGQKYHFTAAAIPGIRRVVGLDDPAVQEAYQRIYDTPLTSIYAPRQRMTERLRSWWTSLLRSIDALPPFWSVFAMTLTETIGAGILALPIAIATIGLIPGLVLLILIGLLNVVTIGAMAEAVVRNGSIRSQGAFLGRVMNDYLGPAGSLLFSLGLFLLSFVVLIAYYLGFGSTLHDVTGIPTLIWIGLLFGMCIFYSLQRSLNTTVSTALLIGGFNLLLILGIALLALGAFQPDYLFAMSFPALESEPGNTALAALFGVLMTAYFGHTSMGAVARTVLHRDPGGRALIHGTMAAQSVVVVMYIIWLVAVNSAIDPVVLAAETGTALIPLNQVAGPVVTVLGMLFSLLALGMVSVHFSISLFNTVFERLPAATPLHITLHRQQGQLVFARPWGSTPVIRSLTYLGVQQQGPRVLLEVGRGTAVQWCEVVLNGEWQSEALRQQVGIADNQKIDPLTLTVLTATDTALTVQVATPLRVSHEGHTMTSNGVLSGHILEQEDADLRLLLVWLLRQRVATLDAIMGVFDWSRAYAQDRVQHLEEAHQVIRRVAADGTVQYRVVLGRSRRRTLDATIWQALGDESAADQPSAPQEGPYPHGLSEHMRRGVSLLPLGAVFAITIGLLMTGGGSFSELIGFVGTVAVSLMAGIFPVLLLIVSRRQGDMLPGVQYALLGHPLVLGVIYGMAVLSLLVHGLVLWDNWLQQMGALVVAGLSTGLPFWMWRQGYFQRRSVLVLHENAQQQLSFQFLCAGTPVAMQATWEAAGASHETATAGGMLDMEQPLHRAHLQLPPTNGQSLKLWLYRTTNDGAIEPLPVRVCIVTEQQRWQFDLLPANGQVMVSLRETAAEVAVEFVDMANPTHPSDG